MLAGLLIYYYGKHWNDLQVLNDALIFFIGICIWIVFYLLLDVAEVLD